MLDTDIVSRLLIHPSSNPVLVARVLQIPPEQLFITVITLEEMLRGALAEVRKEQLTARVVARYASLLGLYDCLKAFNILAYSDAAEQEFRRMSPDVRRAGTQDCRIASVALVHGYTVVTANTRHFAPIRGLLYEDWTQSPSSRSF